MFIINNMSTLSCGEDFLAFVVDENSRNDARTRPVFVPDDWCVTLVTPY